MGDPLVTVAVCTRDRAESLGRCLDSLRLLKYPRVEVLVVDNTPASDATRRLVFEHHAPCRYVCEPRPGLNWARNRAILEARGEVVAYTDDDATADPGWVTALVGALGQALDLAAVTGPVIPEELETEAQFLFEAFGGFNRGFHPLWGRADRAGDRGCDFIFRAHQFGTGANMAFRRSVFEAIGSFDPALDVGTTSRGGGDLEMFFRVQKEGYAICYEPRAIVRHRHRRTLDALQEQMADWGTGFACYLARSARTYPDERRHVIRFGLWRLRHHVLRCLRSGASPAERRLRTLALAQLYGTLRGPIRYWKACREARAVRQRFGPQRQETHCDGPAEAHAGPLGMALP